MYYDVINYINQKQKSNKSQSLLTCIIHLSYYWNECKLSTWFSPIFQNQIQRLFKDFQEPYKGYRRKTELNRTGVFISIYKQVQVTFDNLTPSSISQKLELSKKFTKCINSCH